MLILCKVFYELSDFILIFCNLQMDCTRSRLIRVIGLCKENVTNKQIAGIIQANIVPSNNHSEASDEWVFVHCCLVFMIITLVSSLLVYFHSRDNSSYPMTEHNGHVIISVPNCNSREQYLQ